MKRLICFIVVIFINIHFVQAQDESAIQKILQNTNVKKLRSMAAQFAQEYKARNTEAVKIAREKGWAIKGTTSDGKDYELQYFDDNGMPVYYITNNVNSAKTISTNKVYPGEVAGLNLSGQGITLREWDGGKVLDTHQEFGGRITLSDGAPRLNDHATLVAGIMIAAGVDHGARGMAYQADLLTFDFNNGVTEMTAEAGNGAVLSNHSYGRASGWEWGNWANPGTMEWHWLGDTKVSNTEDYKFGFYNDHANRWDDIAASSPSYLIVKAAENNRDDSQPAGTPHKVFQNGWQTSTAARAPDGDYDCISTYGIAKNILTVGAVEDIVGGYTQPGDVVSTSFSSWGPADDGRIKPDICANGIQLRSTVSASTTGYGNMSGTSAAAPSVTGSLALLQQHYNNLHGSLMRADTLKALVIHTADEAGANYGPDYEFGWGLMNTYRAAALISSASGNHQIRTGTLTHLIPVDLVSVDVVSGTESLRATLCWTDPAGTPVAASIDPRDAMLVNDLDLAIAGPDGTEFPWRLDPDNPANAATRGDNTVDNVEQVDIQNPTAGDYTVSVSYKVTPENLNNFNQTFSLIISTGSNDLALANQTITTTQQFQSSSSITASNNFRVSNGAEVEFRITGENQTGIVLGPGFSASEGSVFHAYDDYHANTINLSCGIPYNGTTADGNNIMDEYNCTTRNESGNEKVHLIATSGNGTITANISNLGGNDLDVFILSSWNTTDCEAFGSNTATYNNAPAGTYYIVVDGFNGASGSYTLTVTCP